MRIASSPDVRSHAQAAWMEHQILDHVKEALRVTLDWRAPSVSLPRKMSSVQFTMKSFQRHILRMMDMEEQDGYMAVVLSELPTEQRKIDGLRREHSELRYALVELIGKLHGLPPQDPLALESVCCELKVLLQHLDQHSTNERMLLQTVFNCDIGGGD